MSALASGHDAGPEILDRDHRAVPVFDKGAQAQTGGGGHQRQPGAAACGPSLAERLGQHVNDYRNDCVKPDPEQPASRYKTKKSETSADTRRQVSPTI
jgi:hypothetical protein